jgi:transposase InsO family protein
MPWHACTPVSQRYEFVILAGTAGTNFRELCRRFSISRKTGYKWLERYRGEGPTGLLDRSRRPRRSPKACPEAIAAKVIALRHARPAWSGYKLRRRLCDLGESAVPSASTCTEIVRRAGLISAAASAASTPLQRFERATANELWQMDFKGDFPTQSGVRCYPLTLLDDHSRFNLILAAAANQTGLTVQTLLSAAFAQYGLPEAILCDNGSPWGGAVRGTGHTALTVWLLRLGVRVLHGRPYHPQTQGKEERFHRTLKHELLSRHTWRDLNHCHQAFPVYRDQYNTERPHRSLAGDTPLSRYCPSPRAFPAGLPQIDYPASNEVRIVRDTGVITFRGQTWLIGRGFVSLPVGLRPSAPADGQWEVFFSFHLLGYLDFTIPPEMKHRVRSLIPPRSLFSNQTINQSR